jgi:hypothetical protein
MKGERGTGRAMMKHRECKALSLSITDIIHGSSEFLDCLGYAQNAGWGRSRGFLICMEALYPNGGQCRLFTDQPVWFKITTLTTTLMNGTEKKIQFASYQALFMQRFCLQWIFNRLKLECRLWNSHTNIFLY